jgi:hypothetical protein
MGLCALPIDSVGSAAADILGHRHWLQMRWVAAVANSAKMVQLQAIRDWTH